MRTPLLMLHIAGGTLGMLSGFAAMFLRKGSRRHSIAGQVFVASMLVMSSCGFILAMMKSEPGNILGGAFTFYLVSTAWMITRRKDAPGILELAALLVVLPIAATEITFGLQAALSPTGLKYGFPPAPYVLMGSIAVLATVGDIRMLVRGGVSATQRLSRHLWRMCFAQFIAAASIFFARAHLFPAILRKTGVLAGLSLLPLAVLIFWLIRVRFTGTAKRKRIVRGMPQPSLSAS